MLNVQEKQIQIKKSIFTKIFYTSIVLIDEIEDGNIVVDDAMYCNLLEIREEFSSKVKAIKAREEYSKRLLENK